MLCFNRSYADSGRTPLNPLSPFQPVLAPVVCSGNRKNEVPVRLGSSLPIEHGPLCPGTGRQRHPRRTHDFPVQPRPVFGRTKHRTGKLPAALHTAFRQVKAQPTCPGSYSAPAVRVVGRCRVHPHCRQTVRMRILFGNAGFVTVRHDMSLKCLLRANRCIDDGELHGPGHDLETGKQACTSIPEQPDCVRGRHRETGLCRLATAGCCHCQH